MLLKKFIPLILLIGWVPSLFAQRVKRKGVTPIDVTKNKGQSDGKPVYTMAQLVGKWREVQRTFKNNSPAIFSDTNFLNFTSESKVNTRTGFNQASITGEATIEQPGNTLLAAADVYTIVSVNDSMLVLDDQEYYLLIFKKTDQFWFENLGKLTMQQETYKDPVAVNISNIMGNWGVYKKDAKPGATRSSTNIIQYLKITQKTGDHSANGEITYHQSEKSTSRPCNIKLTNTGMEINAGDANWKVNIYKADGKEFIFGNDEEIRYFAKPL